jgi:hypothetical protein
MLDDIGVPARPARASAWLQLVREAPPAILADALGVTANTAVRYATLAGADYLAYAGPRPDLANPHLERGKIVTKPRLYSDTVRGCPIT